MKDRRDSDIITSVLEGDIQGFTRLCDKYYGSLVALAFSILGDHHLAEDAAQETFARALTGLRRLKHRDRFAAWLGQMCRHVAYDLLKKNKKTPLSHESSNRPGESVSAEIKQKVNEALKQLSPKDRQVIIMRYYQKSSYEHMAAILNTSKAAINGRLTRAKKKLAQRLQINMDREVKS